MLLISTNKVTKYKNIQFVKALIVSNLVYPYVNFLSAGFLANNKAIQENKQATTCNSE